MKSWFQYLKSGLSKQLPEDKYKEDAQYGRIRDNIKYLIPSIKKFWKFGLLSIIILLISSVLSYPLPMISKYFIDDVLLKKQVDLVIPVIGVIVALSLASYLSEQLKQYFSIRFSQEVILDLQEKLLTKVLSLPKLFFDKNRSGYLMSRVSNDVHGINWFISGTIVQLIVQILKFIGGLFFIFYLDWRLALPILLSLPLPFFTTRFFAKRSYIMGHYNSELYARANANLQETISTIPLIKSFSAENRALKNIIHLFRKKVDFTYEQSIISTLSSTINQLMPNLAKLIVMLLGAFWIIDGQWELGTLIAYQAYLVYVYGPISQLSGSINQLQSAKSTLDRISTMFSMESEENSDKGLVIDRLDGLIEIKNIYFEYEKNNPIFDDFSLTIFPKQKLAIVGTSGTGKTTLISLILRLYKPQKGDIFFDSISAKELNVRALRKRFGYVAQSTILQSGTILENLKYGNPDATDEKVINAAKIAEIHNDIMSLPQQYDSFVEESGTNFSEGQKQRISIARALVMEPDIIILDEPTSALDNITESSIYQSLPNYFKNKTTITVAHRLKTIQSADKIVFLRKNKKPLIGSFNELSQDDDFRNFFNGNI